MTEFSITRALPADFALERRIRALLTAPNVDSGITPRCQIERVAKWLKVFQLRAESPMARRDVMKQSRYCNYRAFDLISCWLYNP